MSLSKNDPLSVSYSENEEMFNELGKKYGVNIRKNSIGMLVIRIPQKISQDVYDSFLQLNKNKAMTRDDIESAFEGKYEYNSGEIIIDCKPTFDAMEFRHKNGKTTYVKAANQHQQDLIDEILNKQVIHAIGSAGTGKGFISLSVCLKLLEAKKIVKIILSRPAVYAQENIGFMPGSMESKMEGLIAPVENLLIELIGKERTDKLFESNTLQILPVGFSRGLTIGARDGVVLLVDEAQNLNFMQHKLLITRLGKNPNSKIIFMGDQRQSDLVKGSGILMQMNNLLKGSKYFGSVTFTREDIVRSGAVKDLLERIEIAEDKGEIR